MRRSAAAGLLCLLLVLTVSRENGEAQAQDAARAEVERLDREITRLRGEGKFRDAVPLLQTVVGLLEQQPPVEEDALAEVLDRLGETCFYARMLPEAAASLERALALHDRKHGRASQHSASTLNNLANVVRASGNYVRAEELFLETLAVLEKLPGADDLEVASAENNLASLYEARGDFARAEPRYLKAIAIFQGAGRPESVDLARALNNLGLLYQSRGNLDGALPIFERSLAIRHKLLPPNHPDVARGLGNLAANYQQRGDFDRAEPLYDQALAIYQAASAAESTSAATVLLNRAMISLLRGNYADAEPQYRKSLDIRERLLGPEHPETGGALERLAVFYQTTGRIEEAFEALRRSAEIAEHNLALTIEVGSEEQKIAYMKTLQENTDIVLSMRRDLAAREPAFTGLAVSTVVQRQGRVLETLVNAAGHLRESLDPAHRQLFDDLATARSQVAQFVLTRTGGASPDQRAASLSRLRSEIDRLERTLAAISSEARIQLRPVAAEDVLAALPADSALVEYVKYRPFDPKAIGRFNRFLPAHYAALVLRPGTQSGWVELGTADTIEAAVAGWRSCLVSPQCNLIRRQGRIVSDLLLGPIAAQTKGARHLYFVPDDVLNLVPFAALPVQSGRYLLEETGVSYLASSRDVLKFGTSPPAREQTLIVAAPAFGPPQPAGAGGSGFAFSPLLGTAREGDAVARLIPGSRLATGSAATGALVRNVHGPAALHLATHAFFVGPRQDTRPQSSNEARGLNLTDRMALDSSPLLRAGIALAHANAGKIGSNREDGLLTALEAASLDLHGTRLVVLSGCATGLGAVRAGDGVHGFRRALAIAGAETLVLTLWRIDDASTAQLMAEYYGGLRNGAGREAALTSAQLSMLRRPSRRHPYHWAAFVLAGDASPMSFDVR